MLSLRGGSARVQACGAQLKHSEMFNRFRQSVSTCVCDKLSDNMALCQTVHLPGDSLAGCRLGDFGLAKYSTPGAAAEATADELAAAAGGSALGGAASGVLGTSFYISPEIENVSPVHNLYNIL